MDYQTKPTSREEIRNFAIFFRMLFEVEEGGPFPVLKVLDHVCEIFPGSNYKVVKDQELPSQTMAQCTANDTGGYTIEIKESIYAGAYQNHTGACLGFICHEICHIFLFSIGYTPIMTRTFASRGVPSYCSVEWQAKALCGEVMIPFEESRGMTREEIIDTYHVSKGCADYRLKLSAHQTFSNQGKIFINLSTYC